MPASKGLEALASCAGVALLPLWLAAPMDKEFNMLVKTFSASILLLLLEFHFCIF